MDVAYPFHEDQWGHEGPDAVLRAALSIISLPDRFLAIDFGCGPGVWLQCCKQLGSGKVLGLDGSFVPKELDQLAPDERLRVDLTARPAIDSRYDLGICTEVAEHLSKNAADVLIDTITSYATTVIFSAAAPGQAGSGHIHCQWPEYWQNLFNHRGFSCSDGLRWVIWDNRDIEPWYRQNILIAQQSDCAGSEPRIPAVVHPDMLPFMSRCDVGPARRRGWARYLKQTVDRFVKKREDVQQ